MNEIVSKCSRCGKAIYCIDGFFNGIHTDDKITLCFTCAEENEKSAE